MRPGACSRGSVQVLLVVGLAVAVRKILFRSHEQTVPYLHSSMSMWLPGVLCCSGRIRQHPLGRQNSTRPVLLLVHCTGQPPGADADAGARFGVQPQGAPARIKRQHRRCVGVVMGLMSRTVSTLCVVQGSGFAAVSFLNGLQTEHVAVRLAHGAHQWFTVHVGLSEHKAYHCTHVVHCLLATVRPGAPVHVTCYSVWLVGFSVRVWVYTHSTPIFDLLTCCPLLLAVVSLHPGPATVAGMAAAKGWRSLLVPAILTSTTG